jgi:hypothetical protein
MLFHPVLQVSQHHTTLAELVLFDAELIQTSMHVYDIQNTKQ